MTRVAVWVVPLLLTGCPNIEQAMGGNGPDATTTTAGPTTSTSATPPTSDSDPSAGTMSGTGATTDPTTTQPPGDTTMGVADDTATSGPPPADGTDSTSDGESSSSSGPNEPVPIGGACVPADECADGGECCDIGDCAGICLRRCGPMMPPCPMGFGCEHEYCLFSCASDAECDAMWPGWTCQHGDTVCEAM